MKIWYCHKNPVSDLAEYDTSELVNFITTNKEDRLFHFNYISDLNPQKRLPYCKGDTVLKAIKNGFRYANVFMYNNHLGRSYFNRQSTTRIINNKLNWSLDLDNINCNNIKDLLEKFYVNDVPIPSKIVQTSPNSFHVMYEGTPDFWTYDNRVNVALLVVGAKHKPVVADEVYDLLKAGGVDVNYFKQTPVQSKIRVPGSINTNVEDQVFICKGWTNPAYDYQEVIEHLKKHNPSRVVSIPFDSKALEKLKIKKKNKGFTVYESKKPYVSKHIKKALGYFHDDHDGKKMRKFIDMVMGNLGFLCKGEAYISQTYWSEKIGISQPSVSRSLKKLREAGILKITDHSYNYQEGSKIKAMKYGFTAEFIEGLYACNGGTNSAILNKPYEDGKFNDQKLAEIRILFMDKGWSAEEITDFIYEKSQLRTSINKRAKRVDILADVRSGMDSLRRRFSYADDATHRRYNKRTAR